MINTAARQLRQLLKPAEPLYDFLKNVLHAEARAALPVEMQSAASLSRPNGLPDPPGLATFHPWTWTS
jgi:hypothetical protein